MFKCLGHGLGDAGIKLISSMRDLSWWWLPFTQFWLDNFQLGLQVILHFIQASVEASRLVANDGSFAGWLLLPSQIILGDLTWSRWGWCNAGCLCYATVGTTNFGFVRLTSLLFTFLWIRHKTIPLRLRLWGSDELVLKQTSSLWAAWRVTLCKSKIALAHLATQPLICGHCNWDLSSWMGLWIRKGVIFWFEVALSISGMWLHPMNDLIPLIVSL